MDVIMYCIGLNKGIEVKRRGSMLFYRQWNPNGFIIRLKCDPKDKRMVVEKRGKAEDDFVKMAELSVVRGVVRI